ncbi:MAG: RNA polymerase sigma factor [Verrucomicrobiia bacterium]
MAVDGPTVEPGAPSAPLFTTTHWSVVLAARPGDSSKAAEALERLCRTYWYPLYAYVRRHGYSPEDAQDLTQEFFARLLAKDYLAAVQPAKGKFRWFLLSALKRFLVNARERAMARKRGGGRAPVPFDGEKAEDRYRLEAADHLSPDKLFDRAWAANQIDAAYRCLEEECALEGKRALLERLKVILSGDREVQTYAEIGADLGLTEGAMKVAVHRLRRRYRELLREQVAQTVPDGRALEEELRDLLAVFAD